MYCVDELITTCPRCGRLAIPPAVRPEVALVPMRCGGCGDAWRWSDGGQDAFSEVLAHTISTMAPVEDEYSATGLCRAARYELCLGVRYRIHGETHWRRGISANVSRSGMLVYVTEVGALAPLQRTGPITVELAVELIMDDALTLLHCQAAIARIVPPNMGDIGAMAVTVGDYILSAS